ncbi:T9SS type A sorting domain-containing protein [Persicobacter psychrovividus]|uniref:PKD domain-containing protein n=1 Tax=Persicobacter psychrovividus TaxID=387638 RepID=A0ABM7VK12_9BACT|nr:hypothetical protein PEPS_36020 [Persicobacter psychrovividus]
MKRIIFFCLAWASIYGNSFAQGLVNKSLSSYPSSQNFFDDGNFKITQNGSSVQDPANYIYTLQTRPKLEGEEKYGELFLLVSDGEGKYQWKRVLPSDNVDPVFNADEHVNTWTQADINVGRLVFSTVNETFEEGNSLTFGFDVAKGDVWSKTDQIFSISIISSDEPSDKFTFNTDENTPWPDEHSLSYIYEEDYQPFLADTIKAPSNAPNTLIHKMVFSIADFESGDQWEETLPSNNIYPLTITNDAGTLTIEGYAPVSVYNHVFQNLQYAYSGNAYPADNPREVSIELYRNNLGGEDTNEGVTANLQVHIQPNIGGATELVAQQKQFFQHEFTINGPIDGEVYYQFANLPNWLEWDDSNKKLQGYPARLETGSSATFALTVSFLDFINDNTVDGEDKKSQDFTITIANDSYEISTENRIPDLIGCSSVSIGDLTLKGSFAENNDIVFLLPTGYLFEGDNINSNKGNDITINDDQLTLKPNEGGNELIIRNIKIKADQSSLPSAGRVNLIESLTIAGVSKNISSNATINYAVPYCYISYAPNPTCQGNDIRVSIDAKGTGNKYSLQVLDQEKNEVRNPTITGSEIVLQGLESGEYTLQPQYNGCAIEGGSYPLNVGTGVALTPKNEIFSYNGSLDQDIVIFSDVHFDGYTAINPNEVVLQADGPGVILKNGVYYFNPSQLSTSNGADVKVDIKAVNLENGCVAETALNFRVVADIFANDFLCNESKGPTLIKENVTNFPSSISINKEQLYSQVEQYVLNYKPTDIEIERAKYEILLAYRTEIYRMSSSILGAYFFTNENVDNPEEKDLYYDQRKINTEFTRYVSDRLRGYVKTHRYSNESTWVFGSSVPPPIYPDDLYYYTQFIINLDGHINTLDMEYSLYHEGKYIRQKLNYTTTDYIDFSQIATDYCSTQEVEWNFHRFFDISIIEAKWSGQNIWGNNIKVDEEVDPETQIRTYKLNFEDVLPEGEEEAIVEIIIHYNYSGCSDVFKKKINIRSGVPRPIVSLNGLQYGSDSNTETQKLQYCAGVSDLIFDVENADYPTIWTINDTQSQQVNSGENFSYPAAQVEKLDIQFVGGCGAESGSNRPTLKLNLSPLAKKEIAWEPSAYYFEAEDSIVVNFRARIDTLTFDEIADYDSSRTVLVFSEADGEEIGRYAYGEDTLSNFAFPSSGRYQLQLAYEHLAGVDDNLNKKQIGCWLMTKAVNDIIFRKPRIQWDSSYYACMDDTTIDLRPFLTITNGHGGTYETGLNRKFFVKAPGHESEFEELESADLSINESGDYEIYVVLSNETYNYSDTTDILHLRKDEMALAWDFNKSKLCLNGEAALIVPKLLLNGGSENGGEILEDESLFEIAITNQEGQIVDDLLAVDSAGQSTVVPALVGKYNLQITYFASRWIEGGQCELSKTIPFEVFNQPVVTMASFDQPFCEEEAANIKLESAAFDYLGNTWAWAHLQSVDYVAIDAKGDTVSHYLSEGRENKTFSQHPVGHFDIYFYVTDTNSCTAATSTHLQIKALPLPAFTTDDGKHFLCQDQQLPFHFVNQSMMPEDLEKPEYGGAITRYQWQFGNGFFVDNGLVDAPIDAIVTGEGFENNTSGTYKDPAHFYLNANEYEVSLTAFSEFGCKQTVSDTVELGANPQADFEVMNFTAGQGTYFIDQSSIEVGITNRQIESWEWQFGNGDQQQYHNGERFEYGQYMQEGIYEVKLILTSEVVGCTDTVSYKIPIFPLERPLREQAYQVQFDQGAQAWLHSGQWDTADSLSSWGLNEAGWQTNQGSHGNNQNSYFAAENSWVESPTFDLSKLDLPMLTLRMHTHSAEGVDGLTLRYTTDEGHSWQTVGATQEGIDWYSHTTVLSMPQDAQRKKEGWSGTMENLHARIPLDQVKKEAIENGNGQVRFRFWFASNAEVDDKEGYQGVSIASFELSSRNHHVVTEHFIHDFYGKQETEAIRQTVQQSPEELILLQYPYQLQNESENKLWDYAWEPAGARGLHYGIPQAERAMVDGRWYQDEVWSKSWGLQAVSQRKLQQARVLIDPISRANFEKVGDHRLSIDFSFQSSGLPFDTLDQHLLVHTLLVAKSFKVPGGDTYEQLVRQMLPDASGQKVILNNLLNERGGHWQGSVSWQPDVAWAFAEGVQLVVLVQGMESNEIYQSETFDIPQEMVPQIPTDNDAMAGALQIYPNPNDGNFVVKWPQADWADAWQVYNVTGVQVARGQFSALGAKSHEIQLADLPVGVYVLVLSRQGQLLTTERLVIRH